MSESYIIESFGHNSIYTDDYLKDNYHKRKFKIYFNCPEAGINKETGILLLIAGFGGNSNSNVYKKMRNMFSDKYNLVTIQCDYFGWEYMQSDIDNIEIEYIDLDKIKKSVSESEFKKAYIDNIISLNELTQLKFKEKNIVKFEKILNEDLNNFNDMGIMQAVDNITAVINVMNILYDNNYIFNTKKVIIMGDSHGAYLGYLCNYMCNGLFSYLLDNSAWIYPKYFLDNRISKFNFDNLELQIKYRYLAKRLDFSFDFLNLKNLYKDFNNRCKIVIYHGEDDILITIDEKYNGVKNINNIIFNRVNIHNIDKSIFKSTGHGLEADFINLFDSFYNEYVDGEQSSILEFQQQSKIEYSKGSINIDYKNVFPQIYIL